MHPGGGMFASTVVPIVSPRLDGRTNINEFLSTVYSGCQLQSDGDEYEYSSNASLVSLTTWLDQGSSSHIWVSRSISAGSFNSIDPGSGRHQLSTTRSFRVARSTTGVQTCTATFSFFDRATGGNTLVTTSSSVWTAEKEFNPCPLCCFTPDTPITLASGIEMPIGKVREGDMIMCYDVETNQPVAMPVTEVILREKRNMYLLEFADGRQLRVSDDHPFYVKGQGPSCVNPLYDYKNLGKPQQLHLGNMVSLQDGSQVALKSITPIDYPGQVVTFGNSLFYANGILVY